MIAGLKPGDTIGVAAPSARFDKARLEQGVQQLEAMGFKVHIPVEIFDQERYLAGRDETRARVVRDLFLAPEIKGIICARGGFGAMRMLSYLNWEEISAHPTWFIGFSDASAMLCSLIARAGMPVIHGPNLVSLAQADAPTLTGFERAVSGKMDVIRVDSADCLVPGVAHGKLVGGNLATLVHLVGTPMAPDLDNAVFFMEDVGEPAYKIDRMLSQMKMAGLFRRIRGVVTGSFEDCANPEYIPQIILETFVDQDVPILMGLAAGHGATNLALPMGRGVTLDSEQATLTWDWK